MEDIYISDIDKPAGVMECEHDECSLKATVATEYEWEMGGRWWELNCDSHADEKHERIRTDRHEREKKEQGFCPECGYRKTNHAEDCYHH